MFKVINKKEFVLCILNRNESANLINLIQSIRKTTVSNYFAIDGMSTDSSLQILNSHGIHTIVQNTLGRWNAIRLGIESASSLYPDAKYLILISSDGNEDPNDIEKMIELLPNFDLVIQPILV